MDVENIEIAKAELSDIEDILLIQKQTRVSNFDRGDYIQAVADQAYLVFMAKYKKNSVGFILARLITYKQPSLLPNQSIECLFEIYSIAVIDQYQNKGVGKKLLKCLILTISRQFRINCFDIQLETRESNETAISFYLKNGFSIDGLRKNYYSTPPENALLFSRKVLITTT